MYVSMSGSGSRRTEDFHTLRTRQLILQNQDGTYPEQGSLLYFDSSNGIVKGSSIKIAEGGTVLIVETLESTGIAQFGGGMQVDGLTSMTNVQVSSTMSVLDHTYLQDVDISGSLFVYGNTTLSSCNVTGDLQFNTLGISSSLNVDGSCNVGSLNVQGTSVLNNLIINGTTNLEYQPTNLDIPGYLNVDGSCNVGSLNVQGNTVVNNLLVTGISDIVFTPLNLDVSGYLNVDGPCSLGDTSIGGTLYVAQHSQYTTMDISGYLNVDGSCNVGSLNVEGTTVLNNLTVTGTLDLAYAPSNISGYLNVDGSCNIVGDTSMGGTLRVAKNSQFNTVHISGNLNVDGSCNFHSDLNIVGQVDISGSFRVNNAIVIQKFVDALGTSTTGSTITILDNGYLYCRINNNDGSILNIHGSGLPIFGYLVWDVRPPGTTFYLYAPTYPIISSCDTNGSNIMGLPNTPPFTQDPLKLAFIVVAPYTTIVFNNATIGSVTGFTCDNRISATPKTFANGNGKTITQITSWYVYRYTTAGVPVDGGESYFVSNSSTPGIIT